MTDPIRASEALAVRSLLEEVARMGDCIGRHTVGKIMEISDRAATWLAENPPGQPVAIEPRGCPTPGACSCVQPTPPAEGEVGEPSDEDLLGLTEDWPATTGPRHDLSGCPEVPLYSVFADEVVEFARAVLARWGNHSPGATKMVSPAPVPAEGEMGELVADLRATARGLASQAYPHTAALITRAADLLEQRHPAPVPVSERLPGPEDCQFNPGATIGSCWCWNPPTSCGAGWWSYEPLELADDATYWLPAHALPLPQAREVQP